MPVVPLEQQIGKPAAAGHHPAPAALPSKLAVQSTVQSEELPRAHRSRDFGELRFPL